MFHHNYLIINTHLLNVPEKTIWGCGNMFHDIITGYRYYTLCGMPICDVYDGVACLYPTGYNKGCYGVVYTL